MNTIKLGSTCVDKATGYTGVAVSKVEMLNGNVQYAIIPKAKPGSGDYPAGINLDGDQLSVVDAGISDDAKPEVKTDLKVGEKVKDVITGMSGIIIHKTTFFNGCVYFTVAVKDAKKDPADLFLSVERLERVSSGILAKLTKTKASKPTGGPSVPMRRAC